MIFSKTIRKNPQPRPERSYMNRGNKTASWNDKPNLEVLWCYIKYGRHPKEWVKLKHFPFSKKIHRIMIRYWLYKVLHDRQNNLYVPVKGTGDKENKQTDTTAIMLYSLKKWDKTWVNKRRKHKLKKQTMG